MSKLQYDDLLVSSGDKMKIINHNVSFASNVFEHMKALIDRIDYFKEFTNDLTEAFECSQHSLTLHDFFIRKKGYSIILRDIEERIIRDTIFLNELQVLIALSTSQPK